MVLKHVRSCLAILDRVAEFLLALAVRAVVAIVLIALFPCSDAISDRAVARVLRIYLDEIPCPLISAGLRRVLRGPRRRPAEADLGSRRAR